MRSTSARVASWGEKISTTPNGTVVRTPSHQADDVSNLWDMGFEGVNFDIKAFETHLMAFYRRWDAKRVRLNMDGAMPPQFPAALRKERVPTGLGVDFFKMDIDSFDCHVLEEVMKAGYRPKVLMMECENGFPPPLRFAVKYSPSSPYN